MVSLENALGSMGGFVAGKNAILEYLGWYAKCKLIPYESVLM